MPDLAVTPSGVLLVSTDASQVTRNRVAGSDLTAGQSVVLDTNNKWIKGDANTQEGAGQYGAGIMLHAAFQDQPAAVARNGTVLSLGATLVQGTIYVVSGAAAGNIAPIDDLTTGMWTTILGYANDNNELVMSIIVVPFALA